MYPVFPPPRRRGPSPRSARCPDCDGLTGEYVCAECHTPLPVNFGSSFSPVIAVVGARSTGKTVYLAVVANHLRTVLCNRFAADVCLFGDNARATLEANVEAIFNLGKLPGFTEHSDGRSEPLVFGWHRPSGRSSYLSFLNTAGESLGIQRGMST